MFLPFAESMSLEHQEVDIALKSPNMTETDGLRALIGDRRCSKFVKAFEFFLFLSGRATNT